MAESPATIAKRQQAKDVAPDKENPVDTTPDTVPDDAVTGEHLTRVDHLGRVNTEVPAHADNETTRIAVPNGDGTFSAPMTLAEYQERGL